MTPLDALIAFAGIIAVFGTGFYIVYKIFKLIRIRMENKGGKTNEKLQAEFEAFKERTEKRLRSLEEIAVDDGLETLDYTEESESSAFNEKESETKSRLKNQLKG